MQCECAHPATRKARTGVSDDALQYLLAFHPSAVNTLPITQASQACLSLQNTFGSKFDIRTLTWYPSHASRGTDKTHDSVRPKPCSHSSTATEIHHSRGDLSPSPSLSSTHTGTSTIPLDYSTPMYSIHKDRLCIFTKIPT